MTDESIKLVLSTAQDGRTQDLRYRQRQFRALHAWTVQHVSEIKSAMRTDDSFSEIEAHFLITLMSNKLTEFYDSLDLKAELASEYSVKDGRDNESHRVSEELVYVIPKKYSLISNVFSILCPCVAAGSCCILEVRHALKSHGQFMGLANHISSFPLIQTPAQGSWKVPLVKL